MFDAIKQFATKVKRLDENRIVKRVLRARSDEIIEMNQRQLYDDGIQSDGSPTGEYAERTKQYKLSKGDSWQTPGRTDHITGNDTGVTYRSMRTQSENGQLVITVDDRNGFFQGTNSVPARAPFGIGLTEENMDKLQTELTDDIIEEIYKQIT